MRRSYSPKTEHAVDLSIIVPVFDEKANVRFVLEELHQEFGVRGSNTEFIVVDDGSTDGTLPALIDCLEKTPQLRIVSTESHRGQSAALWLGFAVSRGELIATLDGDGQFYASDLKLLLQEIARSNDAVFGIRVKRYDSLPKRLFSYVANRIRCYLTKSSNSDSGCSMRVFKRELMPLLLPFDGFHRFLPTMFEARKVPFCVVPVRHRKRNAGQSKYGIARRAVTAFVDLLMIRWYLRKQLTHGIVSEYSACDGTSEVNDTVSA